VGKAERVLRLGGWVGWKVCWGGDGDEGSEEKGRWWVRELRMLRGFVEVAKGLVD